MTDAVAMGYPRSQLVVAGEAGTYHCVTRCVRRAFLCGEDAHSGRNFDHRKRWVEDRLLELASVFSISVLAYAVMSNHVHVVLHVDPAHAATWTDEEVAARWVRLFPVTCDGAPDAEGCRFKVAALLANPERMLELRRRLCDLPWFMRCLSEPIARRANLEDRCTGRFWEGRYRSQALLDESAVLACMVYVDLNPVRTGVAASIQTAHHTSVQRRLQTSSAVDRPVAAVAGPLMIGFLPLDESTYIRLVDWTGRHAHSAKLGVIGVEASPPLPGGLSERDWLRQVRGVESIYCRAIGNTEALMERARAIGQRWLMVRRVARIPV